MRPPWGLDGQLAEREPEAGAADRGDLVVGLRGEALEDRGAALGRDAVAAVGDLQEDAAVVGGQADPHLGADGRVADRVVDQVGEGATEQAGVDPHRRGVAAGAQDDAGGVGLDGEAGEDVADQRAEVGGHADRVERALLVAVDVEQVEDQPQQLARLRLDLLGRLARVLGDRGVVEDRLGVQGHRADRGLEVVDQERGDLLLLQLEAGRRVALAAELLEQLAALAAEVAQAQGGLHAHGELGGAHRLGQEVVAAGQRGAVEGLDVTQRGQEQHGDLGAVGQGPDPLADREAVEAGHAHVEQHAVGRGPLELGEGREPVVREDDGVALVLQHGPRELAVGRVVVDDQDHGRSVRSIEHWAGSDSEGSQVRVLPPASSTCELSGGTWFGPLFPARRGSRVMRRRRKNSSHGSASMVGQVVGAEAQAQPSPAAASSSPGSSEGAALAGSPSAAPVVGSAGSGSPGGSPVLASASAPESGSGSWPASAQPQPSASGRAGVEEAPAEVVVRRVGQRRGLRSRVRIDAGSRSGEGLEEQRGGPGGQRRGQAGAVARP
jgi:hypothetical protein